MRSTPRSQSDGPFDSAQGRPTIVCAQAGNVSTGACDPLDAIVEIAHARGAWVHVDGAFGLWAAAVPELRSQVAGIETADSWATDAHKWLNVPYDSGLAIVADAAPHRAAMSMKASYLQRGDRRGAHRHGLGAGIVTRDRACCRSTRCSDRSDATASPTSSAATARSRGAWPIACRRSPASRS